mmetsp:Transcript_26711/g.78669  ORF Transcript_26711/g.78669 Transcript_26711/m.78669 type:complete len:253 (-) Transcript_26711:51-809(-)
MGAVGGRPHFHVRVTERAQVEGHCRAPTGADRERREKPVPRSSQAPPGGVSDAAAASARAARRHRGRTARRRHPLRCVWHQPNAKPCPHGCCTTAGATSLPARHAPCGGTARRRCQAIARRLQQRGTPGSAARVGEQQRGDHCAAVRQCAADAPPRHRVYVHAAALRLQGAAPQFAHERTASSMHDVHGQRGLRHLRGRCTSAGRLLRGTPSPHGSDEMTVLVRGSPGMGRGNVLQPSQAAQLLYTGAADAG